MKISLFCILSALMFFISGAVFADVVEVPIDVTGTTYTLGNVVVPTAGDYYYTYTGHRCFASEQKTVAGSGDNVIILHGPATIYCYNYP